MSIMIVILFIVCEYKCPHFENDQNHVDIYVKVNYKHIPTQSNKYCYIPYAMTMRWFIIYLQINLSMEIGKVFPICLWPYFQGTLPS